MLEDGESLRYPVPQAPLALSSLLLAALNFAHLGRCAAAIFLRAAADMVRL